MMKKLSSLILLLALGFASCNQDDKEPEFNVLGYWTLIEIRNSWPVDEVPVDIDFEEKYIFNDDGTFIKFSNKVKGMGELLEIPKQAFGKYQKLEETHPNPEIIHTFELTFETNQMMAANCGEGDMEFITITRDNKLINMTWAACDGPGYVYSKRGRLF
ncbi:hypothetical protein [Mongoliibacter ruber]|uniref:Lipocalin-like protein n=1 Tax=Mongoliibacter ruber TaxID=1750599 RepID=A0A2T0WEY2_9BACT|nr:hypothetical protein [Mongoliibacter ruber]PRY85267.1 hypothetical protein CLW00_11314 [Mongoliibacter ruber]